jgi:hypothetical protein
MIEPSPDVDPAPSSKVIDDIQPEGLGHVSDDERPYSEQRTDPKGESGPSYERDQIVHGKERTGGGSSNPHGDLSHADSGNQQ